MVLTSLARGMVLGGGVCVINIRKLQQEKTTVEHILVISEITQKLESKVRR